MKIRSITIFCQPGFPPSRMLLERLGIFARHATAMFTDAGYEVQSYRLATPPFPAWIDPKLLLKAAQVLSVECHADGFDYFSLGPVSPENLEPYQYIPEVIKKVPNVFFSGMLTTAQNEVSLPAARACAQLIEALAPLDKNGFANLRFCALANVPPFAPFFPAAYGEGFQPSFALAIEGADLAIEAFSKVSSLENAREFLIRSVESHAQKLEEVANKLQQMYGYDFKGLDFTLAPYPNDAVSIAKALETLGLQAFGLHGSLFCSAFLTEALDRAKFKRTGFNGLMLPVLEDSGLSARVSEGKVSVTDLLVCSSVCGTGLDVIPLPGSATADQLYPVLLDTAALALRLKKPLTARLMPIPGKAAGDLTAFEFEYFSNCRVMELPSSPLTGLLVGRETLGIRSRFESGD